MRIGADPALASATAGPPARPGTPALVEGLPGLDPSWSRRIDVIDGDGVPRTWHLLDTGAIPSTPNASEPPGPPESSESSESSGGHPPAPVGTMLCLHGNPTWSYLWRRFLAAAPPGWRVVAPDQLGMGWSERLERPRTLAERIDDLDRLTTALGLTGPGAAPGPVVAVAHDWGGPVLLGWAERHVDRLAGLVLTNTGVVVPAEAAPPSLIRLARSAPLLRSVCVRTPAFVRGATALSRPPLPRAVRDAFAAPYTRASRRRAVGDFVADIPLEASHPTRPVLDDVVDGLARLADVPTLLVWGPRDPIFSIRYLHDLRHRLPHADVQLYPRASHLVVEDASEAASDVWSWVTDAARVAAGAAATPAKPTEPLWQALLERGHDDGVAVAELGRDAAGPISFAALEERVADVASGLLEIGVRPGHRVALLVRPGIDLTVAVYACWRAGAAIVVADAGLGLRGLGRALRSADPDHLIAIPQGLLAAVALRVPGERIGVGTLPGPLRRRLRVRHDLAALTAAGRAARLRGDTSAQPRPAGPEAETAVLFTSGATGPAKGVVYRQRQLRAQLDYVRAVCGLQPGARLVAAFAPFALYAPALGAAAAVPDMDVTRPGTLTATALAEAVRAIDATVVFASPAALRNVAATAHALPADLRSSLDGVRTLLSAGAPVPTGLLREIQRLLPHAQLHTPYGMTEALPVTDVTLPEIERAVAEAGTEANGVCVGTPLPGVRLRIEPLDPAGRPGPADRADQSEQTTPGRTGEICVAAAHVKDHYDRLWVTQRRSASPPGWHRTGDVGHLDGAGRLWVEGRLGHVITAPGGPRTPVGPEQCAESLPAVRMAAAVGVGPVGTQQLVLVVVETDRRPRAGLATGLRPRAVLATGLRPRAVLATPDLAAAVRAVVGQPVAAVLVTDRLPVDIRHASKIDRARVARWAEHVLAGGRAAGRWRRP